MAQKTLFNLNRLVADSGKEDASPEASFLLDLDYTIRKLNEYKIGYYFKQVYPTADPQYFSVENKPDEVYKRHDVICVDTLPEPSKKNVYNETHFIYHTNDQKYYVCLFSDGKPSKTYKPSSLKCLRNMYYQIVGAELDKQGNKSSDFYGICESGTDRHERIQYAISKMSRFGVNCEFVDVEDYVKTNNLPLTVVNRKEYEVKLFDEKRNVIFLCDGIIKYKDRYYILEIKTESSYKWMDRKAADPDHRFQAYTYSLELGIDDVIFIYENRDFCTKKPFLVHVTDDNRNFINDRIASCQEYVDTKKVPPLEPTVDKHTCQYCDYRTVCKVDSNESSKQG